MDEQCNAKYWGKDPRSVNIDEFVGTWIPLLIAPFGQYIVILSLIGFASFKLIFTSHLVVDGLMKKYQEVWV